MKLRIKDLKADVALLIAKGLTEGKTLKEVREELVERGLKPNSSRSVDLYLDELRTRNNCKTTYELMYQLGRGMQLKIKDNSPQD